MHPFPVPVRNVTIYPYYGAVPLQLPPVIEGARGTYAVGTLATSVFYNLNLEGGRHEHRLRPGQLYTARAEDENGDYFDTPAMHCLSAGDEPTFGRTMTLGQPGGANDAYAVQAADHSTGPYIVLGPLTDTDVTYVAPAPIPLSESLIRGGHGYIIATRVGTPHLMGVMVEGGERRAPLPPGMHHLTVSAENADGHRFWQSGLTVVDGGDPAILLQTWPPRS